MAVIPRVSPYSQPVNSQSSVDSTKSDDVATQIMALKSEFSALATEVTDAVKTHASVIQKSAIDHSDEVRVMIRQRPMQATLVAVGIGFIAGLLLSR